LRIRINLFWSDLVWLINYNFFNHIFEKQQHWGFVNLKKELLSLRTTFHLWDCSYVIMSNNFLAREKFCLEKWKNDFEPCFKIKSFKIFNFASKNLEQALTRKWSLSVFLIFKPDWIFIDGLFSLNQRLEIENKNFSSTFCK